MSGTDRQHSPRPARTAAITVALATLTAGVWWLWLGSDTTYRVDPVTGVSSGPYEAPQIVACGVCLIVLATVGALMLPAGLVVVTMTVVFTGAWSINASSTDTTGLWAVGAVFLFLGMLAGLWLVVATTSAIRRVWARRHRRTRGATVPNAATRALPGGYNASIACRTKSDNVSGLALGDPA